MDSNSTPPGNSSPDQPAPDTGGMSSGSDASQGNLWTPPVYHADVTPSTPPQGYTAPQPPPEQQYAPPAYQQPQQGAPTQPYGQPTQGYPQQPQQPQYQQ